MAKALSRRLAVYPPLPHARGLLALVFLGMGNACRATMQRSVGVLAFKAKILNSIVRASAVDVVDNLIRIQRPAQRLLHCVSVLKNVPAVRLQVRRQSQQNITGVVDVPSGATLHAVAVVPVDVLLPPLPFVASHDNATPAGAGRRYPTPCDGICRMNRPRPDQPFNTHGYSIAGVG